MPRYEAMFIIRPDTPDEEVEKVISLMEGYVTGAGGHIEKIEKLGRRKLAYRIERHREGFYVLFVFEGVPAAVSELERRMKVADAILKFLTVRTDEAQKRGAKLAAIRAKKQARRSKAPSPPPPQPATPAAEPSSAQKES